MTATPFDPHQFRQLLGHVPTSVTVVTAMCCILRQRRNHVRPPTCAGAP